MDDKKTFTEALVNLQNAASEISKQSTSLEDSLKLFEIGTKEAEFCNKILEEAEQQIINFETGEHINA
ncbi:MAG: exodeoxyribonuclease VII small subunit [Clostridiales bacterium]|jgi:exodeoxyribonuclease VII small subunit|nr:exodeoxyribonuclease VII small subunit [Clostridiales bacterium]